MNVKNQFVFAFYCIFSLASCGGGNSSYSSGGTTSPVSTSSVRVVSCTSGGTINTVHIAGFTFSPGAETVPAGSIVKWQNEDSTTHTVTGGTPGAPNGLFDISLNAGEEKCLQFTAAGSFPYFCRIHTNMTAQVTVQ